jgi:putative phosphoribosyl transferase
MAAPPPFRDRVHAGRVLAEHLRAYAGRDDVVVLGLPRGGVPVAAEVATALRAPLDVLVVRKIGVPGREELAMGAVAVVAGTVRTVRNDDVLQLTGVDHAGFLRVEQRELAALAARDDQLRGDRPPLRVEGRVVIVVDDGLATGATMRAALTVLAEQRPARRVVAVPVGARESCEEIAAFADEVVCAEVPPSFRAVGDAYGDFTATPDAAVRRALDARPVRGETSPCRHRTTPSATRWRPTGRACAAVTSRSPASARRHPAAASTTPR